MKDNNFKSSYGKNPSWTDKLPKSDMSVSKENLKLFFDTMYERQQIWHKRFIKGKDRPWTKDEILANSKFTNVYRELDRNSQWQLRNVILPTKDRKDLIWKIMLFRVFNQPLLFNWIDTKQKSFEGFMPSYLEYDETEFADLVNEFRKEGNNPFTNAYLTNSQACPGKKRDWCYVHKVVPTFHKSIKELNKLLLKAKSPEEIIKFLKSLPSVADFMAHEYYQDFTYPKLYTGKTLMKFDQNDFTNVGPGADLGIRLIFPDLKTRKEKTEAIYRLRKMAKKELSKRGKFKYISWNGLENKYDIKKGDGDITLHQIEMWLCEFQKYWKMQIGLGKQRSNFNPCLDSNYLYEK